MKIDAAGNALTARELRDFINTLPEQDLDAPISMEVDGGSAFADAARLADGELSLY